MPLYLFTGAKVAQYAGKHLHKYIVKRSEYKEGRIEDALHQVSVV
jgi:protein phosphatase 2C family protein 2/3